MQKTFQFNENTRKSMDSILQKRSIQVNQMKNISLRKDKII